MKRILIIFTILLSPVLQATDIAGDVERIRLFNDGTILFVLANNGISEKCSEDRQYFRIQRCGENNSQCISASNRMSGFLLSYKLAGKRVTVSHNNCDVSEVRNNN